MAFSWSQICNDDDLRITITSGNGGSLCLSTPKRGSVIEEAGTVDEHQKALFLWGRQLEQELAEVVVLPYPSY